MTTQKTDVPRTEKVDEENFVETALKLGGKSEEEARTTGAIDRADEQVESLFAEKYQTAGSPVHRAVWDTSFPVELFASREATVPPECQKTMDAALDVTRSWAAEGSLYGDDGKVREEFLDALGRTGYWGLLVDREYGGLGAPFAAFARFLTRVAAVSPTVAGLASVHGCIGAVDPIRTFGSEEQKSHFLPLLASGERLSGFALTEPGAGSDLTALSTTARLDGSDYIVDGEKLFITNAIPGRTVGLVCKIGDRPAVLIADLPDEEDEHFQIINYGLHALRHTHNNGLRFHHFRVPAANLLEPAAGDGLTIAYHGLNRGRVALCATAAGTMRVMLANMLPWARFRKTYGGPICTRELVQRRVGRLAALIVACDALVEWCGGLLDEGYRGEMECTIAKIFGSEAQKEAAIELFMKTHGGRAFLHGHLLGDNVHEFLAPCIYEGEGEMLGLGFLKSLIKVHGKRYYEPIGRAVAAAGLKHPNPANPVHAWKLRKAVVPYLKWRAKQTFGGWRRPGLPSMPRALAEHARFAAEELQRSRIEVDGLMQRHQLRLADRQCAMAETSRRVQDLVVMLTTCLWAARQDNELTQRAADVLCEDLQRGITGARPSNAYYRKVTSLGSTIAETGWKAITGIETDEILHAYGT